MANLSRIPRVELFLLLTLLLLAFGFRAWKLSSVGLGHFDEGVYTFSALGLADPSQPHRLYPEQIKFSPPVFFSLVGLAYYFFGGPSDTAAIFINTVLGTLTVALVWWVGRSWFNPQTGIAAAALLAFSEYHVGLSRTALTDVAFAFFFLFALALIVAALRRQSIPLSVVAGVSVGLAWNTKYHGWFALLIGGAALLPFTWCCRKSGVSQSRRFLLLGIMVVVAAFCYLPWAFFIQSQPGGYAALVQYQRTLMRGSQWFGNLWRQAQMQLFLEGPLTRASVLIAFLCVLLMSGQRLRPTSRFLLKLSLVAASVMLIGGAGTAVLLTLLAMPLLIRDRSSFSAWLVLSWLALWFFVTPLYRPYARLVLPFTVVTYLLAGLWLSAVASEPQNEEGAFTWRPLLTAVAAIIVVAITIFIPDPSDPWRSSRSVPEAAAAMEKIIPAGSRVIVIGEPPLAFYLHLANRPAFERTEDVETLADLHTPVYLVTGTYAKISPGLRKGLANFGARLMPLGTFPMIPSDIRLLDDLLPPRAWFYRVNPSDRYDITLYQLFPKGQRS
ncbi:MAG TPA: glycosyltransferase family 39 protein [Candidatus Binatia bacterium]